MPGSREKLVLGTVQFGLQYGVNSAGRPSEEAVKAILREACAAGIGLLDTSAAYGEAESVLGRCLPESSSFRLVSKYPKGEISVKESFAGSLERLGGRESLYGYLLHHFELFLQHPAIWEDFVALKEAGRVRKIGFSLYEPAELECILERQLPFDLLQIPYNLFDRKFLPYMEELHLRGVEIHVRSTYLQGLFFMDRDCLPEKLKPLRSYLLDLDAYARGAGLTVAELALNANLQNPFVDGVLIGVDNLRQLKENLDAVKDVPLDFIVNVKEKDLLNPVNWK